MLFPEAPFIPAAKRALSDLEGKARSFAGSQISDLCQGPNQAFYRQWSCQHFLPQSVLSSSDVHCGKPLGKYDGNKRGRRGKQKILRGRCSFEMSAGRAFCLCREFLRLFFFRVDQSKSIGSKCCQNYHQPVMVSCTWTVGEERGEKAGVQA